MIDPQKRWSRHGEKPDYAGLLTFGSAPYTEDPAELAGIDAAIIGAPMDELVSDRAGARFGPRAIRAAGCPPGPHLEAGIDAFSALKVVDYGDAPIVPADPAASHQAIQATVAEVVSAGVFPLILGGDHSITEPNIRGCGTEHGPIGLLHFDTHTDTGADVFGAEFSHGTVMRRLVDGGLVDPERYVQVGLRGYWPGDAEFSWQRELGITSICMHDVRGAGIAATLDRACAVIGAGPAFLTIDVDVLDPAFAPGTGTPEPGGMTSSDLLWAARTAAQRLALVGADIVEVSPSSIGSADITALVGDRLAREILTGLALRRQTT